MYLRIAAGIACCGGGIPSKAEGLRDTPIWMMHGTNDALVPVKATKDMEEALRAAGNTKIVASYYAGVGHGAWIPGFAEKDLLDWLFAQKR